VITITPRNSAWVVANFRETQLTRMRVGQKATISVDSLPGLQLNGHVAALSPASGSVTALLPPDNATGNFTKIVQRIPVKIALDIDAAERGRLRLGMSSRVRVDTTSAGQP
jgi:membrane fusion protein (multidrug efflux system)